MHVACASPPHKLKDSWKSTSRIWISPLKLPPHNDLMFAMFHPHLCSSCLAAGASFVHLSVTWHGSSPPLPSPGRVLSGSPGAYPWALLRPVAASLRGAAAGRIGPPWVGPGPPPYRLLRPALPRPSVPPLFIRTIFYFSPALCR